MKALVVSYSNSGATRVVAERIAAYLGAEVDEIREKKPRPRLLIDGQKPEAAGMALPRAAMAAVLGLNSPLEEPGKDPGDYDLVVVGSPVWANSLTPAARSYLRRHKKSLKRVAFFCTCGDPTKARIFAQMRTTCGKEPLATVAVKQEDARTDACSGAIAAFAERLKQAA